MRCDTCKHWLPNEDWDVKAGGLRRCARIVPKWTLEDRVPDELREAKYGWKDDDDPITAAYVAASEKIFSEAKAVVMDGSQYHAELLTRPDFGCVLFETND